MSVARKSKFAHGILDERTCVTLYEPSHEPFRAKDLSLFPLRTHQMAPSADEKTS